jgi:hypothetical protein
MLNWNQYCAMRIVNGEYHATEQVIERALCLGVLAEASYQRDTERLLWWRLRMIDRIVAPASHEQKRSNIKSALQHFREACQTIVRPICAQERAVPPEQRLARLNHYARRMLDEMQRQGTPLGLLSARLDGLERLFSTRLEEILKMNGLTPEQRADRSDDLVAAYYVALGELLG